MTTGTFLVALLATFAAARLFGEIAERLGQPAVLGEIIGGVAIGVSGLRLVDPSTPVLHLLSDLGIILLLFLIGLRTDLDRLLAVGGASVAVAITGVALSFAGGAGAGLLLGHSLVAVLFLGAAISATSIGITVRVLSDLGQTATNEGRVIVGAFAAGLVLARTKRCTEIEREIHNLAVFFVPIFFVTIGAAIDVAMLNPFNAKSRPYFLMGALLTLVAIAAKLIAGQAPFWRPLRRSVVGTGMIPRGEVTLLFAQAGLSAGVLSSGLYSSLAFVVVITTLIVPPVLRALVGPAVAAPEEESLREELLNEPLTDLPERRRS